MEEIKKYPLFNRDRIVYKLREDCLRIGADDDDTVEIRDNISFWLEFIELLDGTNTVEAIAKQMNQKYGISLQKTFTFIKQFERRNLLELLENEYNADVKMEYFQSIITYYSSRGLGGVELLKKLQNIKITILGCGGGGSNLALQLCQLGVGNLHLVDPDVVNCDNINRQALFTMNDIGQLKVAIAKQTLKRKNPYITITVSNKRMNSVADVENEVQGSDWVFCAMDEPPYIAQRITNKACIELKIPCLYCFSQKSAGKMFMVNPRESGCVDCLLKSCDSAEFRKLAGLFLNNKQKLITANIYPNITLLCSWIAKKWLDVYCGIEKNPWNKLFRFSFDLFEEKAFVKFKKESNCPTCGENNQDTVDDIWEVLKIE